MSIIVKRFKSTKLNKEFLDLPWKIWKEQPLNKFWPAPLKMQIKQLLDPTHPFHQHAQLELFGAYENNKLIARVVLIRDQTFIDFHQQEAGYFGFFESFNHAKAARLLFEQVRLRAKELGLHKLIGPFSPSMNYESGILVDGFERPSTAMTAHNPPYYDQLLTEAGFHKARDMYAYTYPAKDKISFPPAIQKISNRLKQRGFKVRSISKKYFEKELLQIIEIGNSASQNHWGFVPISSAEAKNLVNEVKLFYDPKLCLVVEKDNEIASFLFALPDFNELLLRIKNGKLFPFHWIYFLLYKLGILKIKRMRLIALASKPKFESAGLGALIYHEICQQYIKSDYIGGDAAWVMEDNEVINQIHQKLGSKITKTYRLYEMDL